MTLFHELVHARHYQQGTLIPSELVKETDATLDADKPYKNEDAPDGVAGVRVEEYATVGLGDYAEDALTENKYREERRALGEDVKARGHYTHKDAKGGGAGEGESHHVPTPDKISGCGCSTRREIANPRPPWGWSPRCDFGDHWPPCGSLRVCHQDPGELH